ncbi:hypothetical protein ACIOK4_13545 [Streptomyces bottropensis]|uniref:hypothetical protein n=1 Tax=Streptomyces bottropensis TaxID=42235 RepID=UPI00380A5160
MSEGEFNIRIVADVGSATRARERIRSELGAVLAHGREPCDERCLCPVHGTPMFYVHADGDHACQDVNCRYGHGVKSAGPVRPDEEPTP